MARLKRDERVCPFCGENIKAIAIRCRYCQSDVTPDVEPEVLSQPEPEPAVVFEPKEAEPEKAVPKVSLPPESQTYAVLVSVDDTGLKESLALRTWAVLRRRLTLVLAVLVLLAGAGVGAAWWRADHDSVSAGPSGSLVGDDARTEVLVSAADLTQRTLSYDYKTLANDMEVARARMTPTFLKEYNATMAQVRDNTVKNKIVLQAVAVSSAIIKATVHKATVLVFVNQTTTVGTGKSQDQQLTRNSLVVTLTRGDGDWSMSKLAALG